MCNILQQKAITDRQAAYIINSVLLPQILYRSTLTILPKSTINIITGKYTKLCKTKSQMPSTTPNSVMHHRNIYGVKKLADVQSEEQISTLLLRLNDQGLVGETTRARLIQLQVRDAMAEVPTMVPSEVIPYRHCLLSQNRSWSTYTGNYLTQWIEQKRKDLEHVSDEELDLLIMDQPNSIAPHSHVLPAFMDDAELETDETMESSDLEDPSTTEEEEEE
ncbi:hypothetical protein BG005_004600, partial [Podila minutissima]